MRHWGSRGVVVEQLPLFKRLPIPRGAVAWRRRRHRRVLHADGTIEQLAFAFRLRRLESDRDTAFDYPTHAVVRAAEAGACSTDAPRSVFDVAALQAFIAGGRFGGTGLNVTKPNQRPTVTSGEGVIRAVGKAYPMRATAEDEERERRRRAKQRPPKPTRKAKTRGQKLLDMIGDEEDA